VTDAQVIWLGLIAVALLVMAIVQVVTAVQIARTAREVTLTVAEIRQEMRPLIDKLSRIADDAARGTALAVAQVERIDRVLRSATQQIDDTLQTIRQAVVEPMRQGSMVMAVLKAVIAAFRRPAHREAEEEDPLFVG
jgi:predicted DNA-binding protein (UPF0278 family)